MLAAARSMPLFSPDLIGPLRSGRQARRAAVSELQGRGDRVLPQDRNFPIMHVVGIKQEIVERYPWVAINMHKAFVQAKALAMERMENPRIVPLAWYRESWEEQETVSARTHGNTGSPTQHKKFRPAGDLFRSSKA